MAAGKEIPFPLANGRRPAVQGILPHVVGTEEVAALGQAHAFGAEEKGRYREAIRDAILSALAERTPNQFKIALAWNEALCRGHPIFEGLMDDIDAALRRAQPLRELAEAIAEEDSAAICRLWDPAMDGVCHLSARQMTAIKEAISSTGLVGAVIVAHTLVPIAFTSTGIEVRWHWVKGFRHLFAVSVRHCRFPESPMDVARQDHRSLQTTEQCRGGLGLTFDGHYPHVCIWAAVRFDHEILFANDPLRLARRRPASVALNRPRKGRRYDVFA